MTSLASPTTETGLAEAVRKRLREAAGPLKLAEVIKGLPKLKGKPAARQKEQVAELLAEDVRLGAAFSQPSAKKGEVRYWDRDERQFLRDQALELASTPQSMKDFKTTLGKLVKGVDGDYVLERVKELIHDDRLYEHPAKTQKGGPLFGVSRPQPVRPLDKHKAALNKLVIACGKLLTAAGVTPDDLFQAMRDALGHERPQPAVKAAETIDPVDRPGTMPPQSPAPDSAGSLEDMILKAVAETPVVSLASLRAEMPREYQGEAFDQAVLRLADDLKISVSQDADASQFSAREASAYVRDGGKVYTTIMARS